jgi:hypothetical protein
MPNEMYFNLSLGSGGYYTGWYAFVEFYTRKELTFRSDRLPAILGIATRFASLLEFTQMAGLWFEDLHKGLIWKGFGFGITRERHATENWSMAPSWSWLAASFSVHYPYADRWWAGSVRRICSPSDAEILDALVSKSKPSRGFIQLWGSLAHVSLVAVPHVSLMAGKLTKLRKGRRPSLASTKKNSEANHLKLECNLDFRSKN